MIKHWVFVVVLLTYHETVSAQQQPIRVVNTASLSKACNPKGVPTNGTFLGTYQCVANKNSFACDVYMIAGNCFGVVMYDSKKKFVQVDIIKAGKQKTVWKIDTTLR